MGGGSGQGEVGVSAMAGGQLYWNFLHVRGPDILVLLHPGGLPLMAV